MTSCASHVIHTWGWRGQRPCLFNTTLLLDPVECWHVSGLCYSFVDLQQRICGVCAKRLDFSALFHIIKLNGYIQVNMKPEKHICLCSCALNYLRWKPDVLMVRLRTMGRQFDYLICFMIHCKWSIGLYDKVKLLLLEKEETQFY